MSLTSLLSAPDVRARFKSEFTRPRRANPKRLRARRRVPPRRASQLGTAFDYLLRFELERRHPNLVTTKPWVAEAGLALLEAVMEAWPHTSQNEARAVRRAQRFLKRAQQEHDAYLKTGELTDELLNSVWRLAYLDAFYRVPESPFVLLERKEVRLGDGAQELRALLHVVPFKQLTPTTRLDLNPTFGDASRMIGGADADIILDTTVIDIKTTIEPKVPRDHFNQLIGYAALAELGGINNGPPQRLDRFQVYLSRYAAFQTFERSDVIDEARWPDFLEWFAERSRKAFPTREEYAVGVLEAYAERQTRSG